MKTKKQLYTTIIDFQKEYTTIYLMYKSGNLSEQQALDSCSEIYHTLSTIISSHYVTGHVINLEEREHLFAQATRQFYNILKDICELGLG